MTGRFAPSCWFVVSCKLIVNLNTQDTDHMGPGYTDHTGPGYTDHTGPRYTDHTGPGYTDHTGPRNTWPHGTRVHWTHRTQVHWPHGTRVHWTQDPGTLDHTGPGYTGGGWYSHSADRPGWHTNPVTQLTQSYPSWARADWDWRNQPKLPESRRWWPLMMWNIFILFWPHLSNLFFLNFFGQSWLVRELYIARWRLRIRVERPGHITENTHWVLLGKAT